MNKITSYLKETRIEIKKVAWPDWGYVRNATVIIIVVSLLIGFFVMFLDLIFARAIMALNPIDLVF